MKKQIENRDENETKQAATEYADYETGTSWTSSFYEITVKDFTLLATGEIRKVVLEASNRDEAKEIFTSLRAARSCKIIGIRRIVNNIYWVE